MNRLTGVIIYNLANLYTISYRYDAMGNRKAMTFQEGASAPRTITYDYNLNNQMTKLVSDMGTFTFAYDSSGRRIKRTLPVTSMVSPDSPNSHLRFNFIQIFERIRIEKIFL